MRSLLLITLDVKALSPFVFHWTKGEISPGELQFSSLGLTAVLMWELVSGLMLLTQEKEQRCTKCQRIGSEQTEETIHLSALP